MKKPRDQSIHPAKPRNCKLDRGSVFAELSTWTKHQINGRKMPGSRSWLVGMAAYRLEMGEVRLESMDNMDSMTA